MRILILEDDDQRLIWFLARLGSHGVFICKNAADAIRTLENNTFHAIFLDHDLANEHYAAYNAGTTSSEYNAFCKQHLDATTGMAVANYLAENPDKSPNAQIFIHTMNHEAGKRMASALSERTPVVAKFDYMMKKGLKINA